MQISRYRLRYQEAHSHKPNYINYKFEIKLNCYMRKKNILMPTYKRIRWSRGSVLAFGTEVCGFKPGWSCQIFQGEKILSTPPFGREVKLFVTCRIFAACKKNQKCTRGSCDFWSKLPAISCPSSSSFHY